MTKQHAGVAAGLSLAALVTWGAFAMSADDPNPVATLRDDCAMCHDKAPVSAGHVAVPEVSVVNCRACHAAAGERSLLKAVHGKHLEMGLPCASCHLPPVPDRPALDAALNAANPYAGR